MTETKLADTITELVAPLAAGLGLSLWGLELSFGSRSIVRIFVEKQLADPLAEDGLSASGEAPYSAHSVSIDECAELSRLIGLSLEVEDCIPGAFTLEVSSPGLDRTFFTERQLAGALGQTVEITLLAPLADMPDRRKFRGVVTAVPDLPAPDSSGANLPETDSPRAGFSLLAEDCPQPGLTPPLRFSFAAVRQAKQVHLPPAQPLPSISRCSPCPRPCSR